MAEVAQAASTHRQHQVICHLSVMFTCHNVQAPAIEPVYQSNHGSIEDPGLAAVCEGPVSNIYVVIIIIKCARNTLKFYYYQLSMYIDMVIMIIHVLKMSANTITLNPRKYVQ